MARRELLMLAKTYNPDKHDVSGWYLSEKLDGTRCFWDGGITRGARTKDITWAGLVNPKTGQLKTKIRPVATGLWSRYGNPISAPDWFLNRLPCVPLDGELFAGRGNYQLCRSTVSKDKPVDDEWEKIQFAVFSTPDIDVFLTDGEIRNPNQLTDIRISEFKKWASRRNSIPDWKCLGSTQGGVYFTNELAVLSEWLDSSEDTVFLIPHTKLPSHPETAAEVVQGKLRQVLQAGGEGLVLRSPNSTWVPKRVDHMLKVKGQLDDEAIIVGFTSGRKTDKGSKLLGKIGALVLDYNGKRLELSGLTDEEREWACKEYKDFAESFPGDEMPSYFQGRHFRVGDKVTFTYRELSDDGIPKEARYLRKRS